MAYAHFNVFALVLPLAFGRLFIYENTMKEEDAYFAYRLVKNIDWLRGLKKEIKEKYLKINSHSTDEEIREFYVFLVKHGFNVDFRKAIANTEKQIDKHIKNLEKQLKEL